MLSLLGRTLVVVAHPDDETGGCGLLLQRISQPLVLFATNGAPDDRWFWSSFGSKQDYAAVRRAEACAAMECAGVRHVEFIADDYPACTDQHLFHVLPVAMQAIAAAMVKYEPEVLLAPAYEGGHPDHDACSFLCNVLGRHFGIPVWEMPLYHRIPDGRLVCQEFIEPDGSEFTLYPTEAESARKAEMLACYKSQAGLDNFVTKRSEQFRRQPDYDYASPPHPGMLNYEAWQWPIRGSELCSAFASCVSDQARARHTRRPIPYLDPHEAHKVAAGD